MSRSASSLATSATVVEESNVSFRPTAASVNGTMNGTSSGKTKIYLHGHPISHSLAPILHSSCFADANLSSSHSFHLHDSPDTQSFLPLLHDPSCGGTAVTMPHKVSFMQHVDKLTSEGRAIGAINTVFKQKTAADGKFELVGTNTDCVGIRESFLQTFPNVLDESRGRDAMVVGGGGAGRAAVYALLEWMGSSRVYLVNRLESEVRALQEHFASSYLSSGAQQQQQQQQHEKLLYVSSAEQARGLPTPKLIVFCVPDIAPKTAEEFATREIITTFLSSREEGEQGYVLEMCYNPIETTLYKLARAAGWQTVGGVEAMLWQGVQQEVLWTGKPWETFDATKVRRLIEEELKRREREKGKKAAAKSIESAVSETRANVEVKVD